MKKLIITSITLGILITWFLYTSEKNPETIESISKSHILKQQDFTLPDLQGKEQAFSQWNGKVILLNFWATWCPPCRREIPDFIEVYEQHKDKDFIIVGVGTDNKEKIADFVKALGVNYPILTGGGKAAQVSRQYGNHSGALPYSVLIDKQGNIRFRAGGLISKKRLLSQIEPLL